jgi:hypothetical protein
MIGKKNEKCVAYLHSIDYRKYVYNVMCNFFLPFLRKHKSAVPSGSSILLLSQEWQGVETSFTQRYIFLILNEGG